MFCTSKCGNAQLGPIGVGHLTSENYAVTYAFFVRRKNNTWAVWGPGLLDKKALMNRDMVHHTSPRGNSKLSASMLVILTVIDKAIVFFIRMSTKT